MKPGEFIEDFISKDNKHIKIRTIDLCDVKGLLALINQLVDEDALIEVNMRIDYSSEIDYVAGKVKALLAGSEIAIVATVDDKIVAQANMTKGSWRSKDIGNIGIAIANGYRGIGLGNEMMKLLLDLAKKDNYRIAMLEVFSINEPARKLYEKLGFKVVGIVPNAYKIKDKYIDNVIMYREI